MVLRIFGYRFGHRALLTLIALAGIFLVIIANSESGLPQSVSNVHQGIVKNLREYHRVFGSTANEALNDQGKLINTLDMTSTASAALTTETVRGFKPKTGTANAVFVVLAPNSEKDNLVASIKQLEARFNSKYNYPYVILNDDEFSQEFKDALNAATNAEVKFGFIEKPMWSYPDFIDQEKAAREREHIAQKGVPYASSESYRHMCR